LDDFEAYNHEKEVVHDRVIQQKQVMWRNDVLPERVVGKSIF
jgi:hypothetical protein